MKIIPDYYPSFRCIADKCKHNCCIGWEIDIDSETLSKYNAMCGDLGKRLKENISYNDETAYFRLTDAERCPFLNSSGLCDIILNSDESNLCQICTDHPRFRNYFTNFTEEGLGLCCEEAARLILSKKDKTLLISAEPKECPYSYANDIETEFLQLRDDIFSIIQNRTMPISQRIEELISEYGLSITEETNLQIISTYHSLEHLDSSWSEMLKYLSSPQQITDKEEFEVPFEQLLVYFLYRHLPDSLSDGRFSQRIAFSVLSLRVIRRIFYSYAYSVNDFSIDTLADIARQYSSEIEYSEENMEILLELL